MAVRRFGDDGDRRVPEDLERVNSELGDDKDARAVARKGKMSVKAMLTPWMAGASYAELAQMFELPSAASARAAIERALIDAAPDGPKDRSVLVQKVSMTLDMLQRSIITKAMDSKNPDQRAYLDSVLKIIDRKVALHGLNAPSQLLVATPESDELQDFIAKLAEVSGGTAPVEADPFIDMVQDPETGEWREL